MKRQNRMFPMLIVVVSLAIMGMLSGQVLGQTATIGGKIWKGSDPNVAPGPGDEIYDAKVMVQDMETGDFVTYGTVTGNSWTATVPAPGEYVVMFSAPNYDATSRSFEVEPGDNITKDAFLPPLPLPKANLLVYAFEDWVVNGEDDYPDDPPLSGVTFELIDEDGNVVATGVSGNSPTLPAGAGPDPAGLYFFTDIEPGEYHIRAIPPDPVPGTYGWYHTTSEEGTQMWEVVLRPGDPGTEAGAYLVWFGFVRKLGQIPNAEIGTVDPNAGTISGELHDADDLALDALDPAGEVENEPPPPPCVTTNTTVPDGFVVLYTDGEQGTPKPIATAEADPVTGQYEFVNVPPGRYKIFASDIPIDYVWVPLQVNVTPNANLTGQDILLPRFFARTQGYVLDNNGNPIAGATVKFRLKPGSVWKETTTDSDGWYNFDDLEEVETMGFVEVVPPQGYRPMDIDTPDDPDSCQMQLGKRGNRYVMFFAGANYRADLFLEPIPSTEGDIVGFTFNDNLEIGTWTSDGIYDEDEEAVIQGVKVELWNANMDTLIDSTRTGQWDEAALEAQGWVKPYTVVPGNEWGGVYNGPILGFYAFRGLAPGTYNVKVIPPAGFSVSTPQVVTVTVNGGNWHQVNFGLYTQAPQAGLIEGGVFDDLNIDNNPLSAFYMEKAIVTGAPVVVYDHLGYKLDVMLQPSPLCYETAPDTLCDRPDLGDEVEIERRVAPGPHLYYGNDPADSNHNPNYIPIMMTYTMGQANAKFEADWSLPPVTFNGLAGPFMANGPILPQNRPVITNNGGGGLSNADTTQDGTPVLNDVIPTTIETGSDTVKYGDIFRIYGENFGDQQGYSTVTLCGVPMPVVTWTDTYIDIRISRFAMSGPLIVATSTGISNALHLEIEYPYRVKKFLDARSVFVDASNTGPEDGSKDHPWNTITEALEHLPSSIPRFVFVAPGVYHERIQIKESNILLIGSGPEETILDGRPDPASGEREAPSAQGGNGYGPVIYIGAGGENGGVENVSISGFTITGGTVKDDIGCGIFGDYGNRNINICTNMIYRNGGYYGGGIWLHHSNHNVKIWSNIIAENGNYGGYGGGISVNDEPEYEEDEHGEPEHTADDYNPGPPPGEYHIFNNLIFHNFSPDYGGGISLYEVKDKLNIFGNVILENKADDHGGGMFFEDTGPIEIHENIIMRNYCGDDGGGIAFEDVADTISHVRVYNNLIAENIADDRGENHARGGGLAFDDTFYGEVTNNTIVGNIVAGSYDPVGGGMDSERNGHEYNGTDGPNIAPGFSDPKIYNNIIWGNWRLHYDQPTDADEEDLDYTWGHNYQWTEDELHVDNPNIQDEWESTNNSESFSHVEYNDIRGGYSNGVGNIDVDPDFQDADNQNWHLNGSSPVIDQADANKAPKVDLELRPRINNNGRVDMGAYEWQTPYLNIMRIPKGIMGALRIPKPGSTALAEN